MTDLLLHPIGLDRTTWDHVPIEDTLAVDLPGHGNAPWDDMQDLGQVADIVLDMVPAIAEPLDLVGVSLGGMVALHAALRHPSRVRSVVVACALAAAPTEVMLERATKTELVGMHGMTSSMISRWFTPDAIETRPRLIASTERRLLADDPTVIAHFWRLISTHDVPEPNFVGYRYRPQSSLDEPTSPSHPPRHVNSPRASPTHASWNCPALICFTSRSDERSPMPCVGTGSPLEVSASLVAERGA